MGKRFKTFMILAIAMALMVFSGGPVIADQSKVPLIGGGQAYKMLDDFMMEDELIGAVAGDSWYVDSGKSASGDGKSWDYAVVTIDEAINLCAANNGDVVHVAPGHSESGSAADIFDADVAGITIIGYGSGTDMPMVDFLHANSEVAIGAACVTIHNIRFHSNITEVLIGVSVEADGDYATISNCLFDVETTTADEFLSTIDIIAGANYVTVKNNLVDMGLGGATQAVILKGTSAGAKIVGNTIIGDYSTACVAGTVAASTLVDIGNNRMFNGDGADIGSEPCIELNGNSTGLIYGNFCACNLATKAASIVCAKCMLFENYYNEDISGAATGGIIGTASADDS